MEAGDHGGSRQFDGAPGVVGYDVEERAECATAVHRPDFEYGTEPVGSGCCRFKGGEGGKHAGFVTLDEFFLVESADVHSADVEFGAYRGAFRNDAGGDNVPPFGRNESKDGDNVAAAPMHVGEFAGAGEAEVSGRRYVWLMRVDGGESVARTVGKRCYSVFKMRSPYGRAGCASVSLGEFLKELHGEEVVVQRIQQRIDGRVIAVGSAVAGACDVGEWEDVVSVDAGSNHTVAVTSAGRVLATGDNGYGQCDVAAWTDIVAVAAGSTHTLGLRVDGTVLSAGNRDDGRCDVDAWLR